MVETIAPVVHGGKRRWGLALGLHTAGAGLSAAAFGAGLGALGGALGAPFGRAGLVAIGGAAAAYALAELARVRLLVPQLRRQVPDWWRTYFWWPVASFLYGIGLGVGFLTFLAHGTLLVVAVAALVSGDAATGALLMTPFGLVRGLSVAAASRVVTRESGIEVVDRLVRRRPWRRGAANAAVLVATAAAAGVAAARATAGWAELAAATLVVTFAWAAAAKLLAPRRWRAAIEAFDLPVRRGAAARRAVPAAEAAVAAAGLLGFHVAAAIGALVLLLGFGVVLVRVWSTGMRRITCGCFGGRGDVDVRAALVRNVALGLIAIVGIRAPDAPLIAWPGVPDGGDLLPAFLAVAGLCLAATVGGVAARSFRRKA